jgi:flagellar hook-associated protein 3 FlgL
MTLRLSTTQIYQQGIGSVLDNQAQLLRSQVQLGTGKRILSPSDDPSGAVQTLQIRSAMETTEQYRRNGNLAEARLRLEEATLQGVGDNLQRVRELLVQANNDSQTNETRASIAAEIRQRLEGLLGLGNTRDANGEYVFSGNRSQGVAFARDASGAIVYQGDRASRALQISAVRQIPIGDSGYEVFEDIRIGNGEFSITPGTNTGTGIPDAGSVVDFAAWQTAAPSGPYTIEFLPAGEYRVLDGSATEIVAPTAFVDGGSIGFAGVELVITGQPQNGDSFVVAPSAAKSIYRTYEELVVALETPRNDPAEQARLHNEINAAMLHLDQALGRVLDTRAEVGARRNAIETQNGVSEEALLRLEASKSSIEDLDYAEAISRFQQQLVALQAAQQSYTQIQGLSLFNFL